MRSGSAGSPRGASPRASGRPCSPAQPCWRRSCTCRGSRGSSSPPPRWPCCWPSSLGLAVRPRGGRCRRGMRRATPSAPRGSRWPGSASESCWSSPPSCRGSSAPGEMVQSTDAVAHLNRLRQFLETDVFSSLGLSPGTRLPERVPRHRRHARAGRAGARRRHRHPRRGEPHGGRGGGGVLAAGDGRAGPGHPRAVGGPAHRRWAGVGGVHGVPLHPHGLGGAVAQPARDGSPARGARSGAGRLRVRGAGPRARRGGWRCSPPPVPCPGWPWRIPTPWSRWSCSSSSPSATRFALQWRRVGGEDGRRAAVKLLVLALVVVLGLLVVPQVSRQVADTASYDWGADGKLRTHAAGQRAPRPPDRHRCRGGCSP